MPNGAKGNGNIVILFRKQFGNFKFRKLKHEIFLPYRPIEKITAKDDGTKFVNILHMY